MLMSIEIGKLARGYRQVRHRQLLMLQLALYCRHKLAR
jgi:hypothetical protein